MYVLLCALAVLSISVVECQECVLYNSSQLATLTSSSISGEPNYVCLASGTRKDTYRTASVVVSTGGQERQLLLTCTSSGWTLTANNAAVANSSTTARTDCAECTASSNDPTFDSVTQCVACPGSCIGLGQCTSFSASGCCNFYDNDTCTRQCSAGTAADSSTGYVCIDPCSNNPCSNGGNCTATGVSYSCTCAGSWQGERCETCGVADCVTCSQVTDVCSQCRSGLDLLDGGACACSLKCSSEGVLDDSLCQCNCSSGYSGRTCLDKCTVENCRSCPSTSLGMCTACVDGYDLGSDGQTCTGSSTTFIGPLSLAAFIGIVVAAGVVVVLLLLCMVVICCCLCKKSGSHQIV